MTTNAHQNGSVTQQTSRTKADELRKSGHFEEAVIEYALVWPEGDVWTGWGYAHCLRKVGRCKEALEVAKAVHSLDSDFRFGRSISRTRRTSRSATRATCSWSAPTSTLSTRQR